MPFQAGSDYFLSAKNNNAEPMIELVAKYVIERIKQYLEILK